MKLRSLSSAPSLAGVPVLVRVDWNVPLSGQTEPEASLKIERSLETIRWLQKKKAIVIILTHLGRPLGYELRFSTEQLVSLLAREYRLDLTFHAGSMNVASERKKIQAELALAEHGSVHLLENVRFQTGEETNSLALAKAYAAFGEFFVNDAFASCHRKHVSVVALAKQLPAYAGLSLQEEVKMLTRLIQKPKKPVLAIVGGAKLSTKIPVLKALLAQCDEVCLGGAMATTVIAAQKGEVGASLIEKSAFPLVKQLLRSGSLVLPLDVRVVRRISAKMSPLVVKTEEIHPGDIVVDIGPKTCAAWGKKIRAAQTILWNGPVGITEYAASCESSRFLARAIALRAKGSAFGVAGGGDTIPIILATKTLNAFDHVSTGGGAMLEFVSLSGRLPGLEPLMLHS